MGDYKGKPSHALPQNISSAQNLISVIPLHKYSELLAPTIRQSLYVKPHLNLIIYCREGTRVNVDYCMCGEKIVN